MKSVLHSGLPVSVTLKKNVNVIPGPDKSLEPIVVRMCLTVSQCEGNKEQGKVRHAKSSVEHSKARREHDVW